MSDDLPGVQRARRQCEQQSGSLYPHHHGGIVQMYNGWYTLTKYSTQGMMFELRSLTSSGRVYSAFSACTSRRGGTTAAQCIQLYIWPRPCSPFNLCMKKYKLCTHMVGSTAAALTRVVACSQCSGGAIYMHQPHAPGGYSCITLVLSTAFCTSSVSQRLVSATSRLSALPEWASRRWSRRI